MTLRAKKPEEIKKRLKAFFYGAAGCGKTWTAIQFPKPYVIDTERGCENDGYSEILSKNGGVIFQTQDLNEIISECKALLTEKHEYKTLVIDPLTIIYNELVDKAEQTLGSGYGAHYKEANKKIKHLINLLFRLDMNVIITSHAKNEYGSSMSVTGQTYDCYKKMDYIFDLVFHIVKEGQNRVAIIKKSRDKNFEEGSYIPFSFEEMAKRYGLEMIEKEVIPQTLATSDDITKLEELIAILKIDPEAIAKWLADAEAESFDEMSEDKIKAAIQRLNKRRLSIIDTKIQPQPPQEN